MAKFKRLLLQIAFFVFIPVFFGREQFFSNSSIGRFIDFNVPPVDYLVSNAFFTPFFMWYETFNNGLRAGLSSTLIPQQLILYTPFAFTDSSWFLSRWQIAVPFILCGIGYVFLYRTITENDNKQHPTQQSLLLPIFFGLAFTYNNFMFSELSFGSVNLLTGDAAIPFVIAFYWRYLERERYVDLLMCSLFMCVTGAILQYLVLVYCLLGVLALSKKKWKPLLKVLALHLTLSLYWIIPLFSLFSDVASNEGGVSYGATLGGIHLIDLLLHRDYFGQRMIYERLFDNVFEKGIYWASASGLLVLPIILLLRMKGWGAHKRTVILLFVFVLLLMFFSKGSGAPFGSVTQKLYDTIPIFSLFRSLQHYYAIIFPALGVIVAVQARHFLQDRSINIGILAVLTLLSLGVSLPWWITPNFGVEKLARDNQPSRVNTYTLSQGESRFYEINKEKKDFKILTSPPGYSVLFTNPNKMGFAPSQGGDMGLSNGTKPFFCSDGPKGNLGSLVDTLEADMYNTPNFLEKNSETLRILGVRYFIIRKDIRPVFSKEAQGYRQLNYLIDPSQGRQIYEDNSVRIIELFKWLPFIWLPKSNEDMEKIIEETNYKGSPLVSPAILNNSVGTVSKFEYTRINPTRYDVHLQGIKDKIPLFLNFNFHPGWELTISRNNLPSENFSQLSFIDFMLSKPISATHFKGPYGINGWLLDAKAICGSSINCYKNQDGSFDITFTVSFGPQKKLYLGAALSLFVLLIAIFILLFEKNRRCEDR